MFKKFKNLIKRVRDYTETEMCYNNMERDGYAVFGCCDGKDDICVLCKYYYKGDD